MKNINIEEYFKHHPPTTEERVVAHKAINEAALALAKVISDTCDDEHGQMALFAVQQARMFANLGITMNELATRQPSQ